MAVKSITATEAARNFSDVLNQVRYQGAEFDVVRGKDVIARIVPAVPARGVPISQLNTLVRGWPRLGPREAEAFAKDIERALAHIRPDQVEWD
jgi:antitoxin (DNA-binding transcriptional repressor) of toxin-antitoxin stability system